MKDSQTAPVSECLLCGNLAGNQILFELSRPVIRCEACGLVYASGAAVEGGNTDYTESYYRRGVYADYLSDREAIRRNAGRALKELERLTPGHTLLDVGCATGFFLEAARDKGWNVRGLEISEYASAYARRELHLEVESGSITTLNRDYPKFDVITLWDTIEHLDRPDIALANVRRMMREGGVLALSTGDYGSLLRRLSGKRWRLFADPTHNFFFDERTIKRLLSQAGYRIIRLVRRGKWVSLAMILHQSGLPVAVRDTTLLIAGKWNPSLYVNLRDVMTVFARPVECEQEGLKDLPPQSPSPQSGETEELS
jgi:2-polyprenyl-3-methyl-5-hydroxy-6-metoxy-1,4-benzoquinol methylase